MEALEPVSAAVLVVLALGCPADSAPVLPRRPRGCALPALLASG
ncbi:hypothetical protein [Kitasatospora aureofaciens]|nr:hypothetical protein [Kitasatospora aureofaciens]